MTSSEFGKKAQNEIFKTLFGIKPKLDEENPQDTQISPTEKLGVGLRHDHFVPVEEVNGIVRAEVANIADKRYHIDFKLGKAVFDPPSDKLVGRAVATGEPLYYNDDGMVGPAEYGRDVWRDIDDCPESLSGFLSVVQKMWSPYLPTPKYQEDKKQSVLRLKVEDQFKKVSSITIGMREWCHIGNRIAEDAVKRLERNVLDTSRGRELPPSNPYFSPGKDWMLLEQEYQQEARQDHWDHNPGYRAPTRLIMRVHQVYEKVVHYNE